MRIPLDKSSRQPLYRQIAEYIQWNIRQGNYPPMSRLPSVRALAKRNGISRITAEKAYEFLEKTNLVQIRPGSGVFTLSGEDAETIDENTPSDSTKRLFTPFDPVLSEGFTDFAFGGSDPRLFPLNDFKICLQQSIAHSRDDLFAYGDIRGYAPLRQSVSRILSSQGLKTTSEEILITNGSQQALSLICRRFLKPGSRIATEALCYGEALNLFRSEGYEILPVPIDKGGMRTDALKKILQTTPVDMVYTIPNFHNPTGTTLSGSRREELIRLMDLYHFPVIEDDYIGGLDFGSNSPPPLRSMAEGKPVFYIGTFSKMLIPGLRFGYLSVREEEYRIITEYKRYSDLTSPLLIQMALESFINLGRYQNHIEKSRRTYKKRRDAAIEMISESFPEGFSFTVPQGGLFLWINYPESFKEDLFLRRAETAGVKVAGGKIFLTDPNRESPGFRMNFAHLKKEELRKGIGLLTEILSN